MISPYKATKFRVTSPIGYRTNPITGKGTEGHYGLDCVAGGDDTVVAVVPGKVVQSRMVSKASRNPTWQWGNYVAITSDDGYTIYYCHLAKRLVSVGDVVYAGQPIGVEGATGAVTGKHLHIEQRQGLHKCNISSILNYCNIADLLGVPNKVGTYEAQPWPEGAAKVYPEEYSRDGFIFLLAKNFAIKYHDANKRKGGHPRYINGGFFGVYSEGDDTFTLPSANLVCDVDAKSVSDAAGMYINKYISGGKLRISCNDNQSAQFKGKKVSTLIVPASGAPYIADVAKVPADAKYAISGVPTIRKGADVNYHRYVRAQGWDDSCMYATWRSFLGIRDGQIWIISGQTNTKNYIYGCEMYKKLKVEKFSDVIALDGGGSYYYCTTSRARTTPGAREINNIVLF